MATCSGVQATTDFARNMVSCPEGVTQLGHRGVSHHSRRFFTSGVPTTLVRVSDSHPVADSVRLAMPAEAVQIAAIQRRAWEQLFSAELSAALQGQVTAEDMAEVWHRAITRPPAARFRVLVCVEQGRIVGFATTTPSQDPDAHPADDGQVDEFVIDPAAQRRGHGSRLMHACVDTLRQDGFVRARHWQITTDDIGRRFFLDAGWAADGGARELGTDEEFPEHARIKQIRLHTDITGEE